MLRLTLLKIQSKATWLLLILLLILQITCLKSKYHNSQSQYNSFKLRKRSLEQQRRQDQQSIVSSSNHLQLYMPNAIQDEVPLFSPINISSYNQSASLKSEESPTTTKQLSSSSLPTITTTTTRLTNVNQAASPAHKHKLTRQANVDKPPAGKWPANGGSSEAGNLVDTEEPEEAGQSPDGAPARPTARLPEAEAQMGPQTAEQQTAMQASIDQHANSLISQQQAAAYAQVQEANKIASKLNAELCRNFSIGFQNELGGTFTSPNYPNPYPVNLICTRLIEAPIGHFIVLEFRDQFNIEEAGNDCENDKIEIRDGRYGYSKVLARFCGNKFPPEVKSSNEAMWLRFISDSSISHNGFRAIYRFEKQRNIKPNPPFECRFNVTAMPNSIPSNQNVNNLSGMSGNNNGANASAGGLTETIRSGIHSGVIKNSDVPENLLNYTKTFNVSLECIWNITVMPGWKIYLTFSSYELNKPNDCDSNFIEIYEENLTEENQTVKFCGTRTEPQQSKSNVFNIRHYALPTASGSRFEIIYTAFREKGLDESCNVREFDCDDGTCIHESLKCDGLVNCKYRYDEAVDPGPCPGLGESENGFFETEHMVIILIVFLLLVGGMCASIVVSCWGKIQERRKRKLEYHMRKSREASMEGQLNKLGGGGLEGLQTQAVSNQLQASGSSQNLAANKLRLTSAAVFPSADSSSNKFTQLLDASQQQNGNQIQLVPEGLIKQHQLQQMMQQQQQELYGLQHHQLVASNSSLEHAAAAAAAAGLVKDPIYGSRSMNSNNNLNNSSSIEQLQQKSAIKSARLNQLENQLQSVPNVNQQLTEQQMLNNLARSNNKQLISSIYQQQQQHSYDNNSGQYGRLLKQQQQHIPGANYGDTSNLQSANYNPQQRALTLSTMHQPIGQFPGRNNNLQTIYAINQQHLQQQPAFGLLTASHLSNSLTCCADLQNETPLIGDLVSRAAGQQRAALLHQQHQQYQAQNNRLYELRSNTLNAKLPSNSMPRSISAHQLSQRALRNQKSGQQQQRMMNQQQHQLFQQQLHNQQALSYKSMSDAGHANKHQPPNHSLSYPHACTVGVHQQAASNQSPALPPPPPPPNLRSSTACGGLPVANQQQQQQPIDSRRAAFKISRFDTSQLTNDTLQDQQDIMMNQNVLGSTFDDQQMSSTETTSDATFGQQLLLSNNNQMLGTISKVPGSNIYQGQRQLLTHLNDCNFIRRQRANLMNRQELITNQPIVCDCGALERANQLMRQQQQQQQLAGSSREYDDSDEIVIPATLGPANYGNLLAQQQQSASLIGAGARMNQFARFQHQSSELTAEDEDLDVEDDDDQDDDLDDGNFEDYNLEDSEQNSDQRGHVGPLYKKSIVTLRNEELKDAPRNEVGEAATPEPTGGMNKSTAKGRRRHLSGSHTSISCHSCTCGSQLQLDQMLASGNQDEDEDEEDEDDSGQQANSKSKFSVVKSSLDKSTGENNNNGAIDANNNDRKQLSVNLTDTITTTSSINTSTTASANNAKSVVDNSCDSIKPSGKVL